jgi:hypothetical protein
MRGDHDGSFEVAHALRDRRAVDLSAAVAHRRKLRPGRRRRRHERVGRRVLLRQECRPRCEGPGPR